MKNEKVLLHGLRDERKRVRYRPSWIAAELFIHPRTYRAWEACEYSVDLVTAARLSHILMTSLPALFRKRGLNEL